MTTLTICIPEPLSSKTITGALGISKEDGYAFIESVAKLPGKFLGDPENSLTSFFIRELNAGNISDNMLLYLAITSISQTLREAISAMKSL